MGNSQHEPSKIVSSQMAYIHPQLKTSKLVSTNFGPMLEYSIPLSSKSVPNMKLYIQKQQLISREWVSRYLLLPEKTNFTSNTCGMSENIVFYY